MMTDDDRKAIDTAPPLMLAEWWCVLNRWEWPAEGLGSPDPVQQPRKPGPSRRGDIMNAIVGRIGIKECLREWNRERMPGAEFDAWWAGREAA